MTVLVAVGRHTRGVLQILDTPRPLIADFNVDVLAQDALASAREQHHSMQAQCFPTAPQNTVGCLSGSVFSCFSDLNTTTWAEKLQRHAVADQSLLNLHVLSSDVLLRGWRAAPLFLSH